MSRKALPPVILPIIFALFLFTQISLVNASGPFTITQSSDKSVVVPGETLTFNISVTNDLPREETIDIILTGENLYWVSLRTSSLKIGPGETDSFTFLISPTYGTEPKTYNYTIKAMAESNHSEFSTQTVYFYVMEKEMLEIKQFSTSEESYSPGETVILLANIENTGTKSATGWSVKIDAVGEEFLTPLPTIEVGGNQSVIQEVSLDNDFAKGEYSAQATVLDDKNKTIAQATASFVVGEKSEIKQERIVLERVFWRAIKLTASNTGNRAEIVTLTDRIPSYSSWLYTFATQPTEKIDDLYTWSCTLSAGQSCVIEYKANYWVLLIIIFAIAASVGIALKHIQRPFIKKTIRKKKTSIGVHLETKNMGAKVLHGVEVVDIVPNILHLIGEFNVEPSVIKKTAGGVVLLWKIGRLEPGEVRVFSYEVRQAIELLGRVRLPAAHVRGQTPKGFKYRTVSAKIKF